MYTNHANDSLKNLKIDINEKKTPFVICKDKTDDKMEFFTYIDVIFKAAAGYSPFFRKAVLSTAFPPYADNAPVYFFLSLS